MAALLTSLYRLTFSLMQRKYRSMIALWKCSITHHVKKEEVKLPLKVLDTFKVASKNKTKQLT